VLCQSQSKPLNLDELIARIERHVQRQHCIKLALEKAMEEAKGMMAQLERATIASNKSFMLTRSGSTGENVENVAEAIYRISLLTILAFCIYRCSPIRCRDRI